MYISQLFIVNYFKMMRFPKISIYDIIRSIENNIPLKRQSGYGRNRYKIPYKMVKNLIHRVDVFLEINSLSIRNDRNHTDPNTVQVWPQVLHTPFIYLRTRFL